MTDREVWVRVVVAALASPKYDMADAFAVADEVVQRAPKDDEGERCGAVSPDRHLLCLLRRGHGGVHVNQEAFWESEA